MFPAVSLNHAETGGSEPPTPDMGTADFPFSAETVERVRALSWRGPVERTPIEYDPTLVLTPHNRETIISHIAARDGGLDCFYCGIPTGDRLGQVVEHVTPRRRGGSDLIENLVLAHTICNFEKSTAPGWYFVFRAAAKGWIK